MKQDVLLSKSYPPKRFASRTTWWARRLIAIIDNYRSRYPLTVVYIALLACYKFIVLQFNKFLINMLCLHLGGGRGGNGNLQFNDNLKVRISPTKTAKKCNYECHVILCKVYFMVFGFLFVATKNVSNKICGPLGHCILVYVPYDGQCF